MQFNEWDTIWTQRPQGRDRFEGPVAYYEWAIKDMLDRGLPLSDSRVLRYSAEQMWYGEKRPYYQLYPAIRDMMLETSLDIPITSLTYPYEAISINMPTKDNPLNIHSILPVRSTTAFIVLYSSADKNGKGVTGCFQIGLTSEAQTVEEAIENLPVDSQVEFAADPDAQLRFVLKVACAVSILSNSPDFIERRPLSKDLHRWETGDEDLRKRLEDKAERRLSQKGHTIGRSLEKEIQRGETSPHFRRPHLATFWTGKGRAVPVLKLRKGSVIKSKKATSVPTGFRDDKTIVE